MATITKRLDADGKPYYTARIRLKGYPEQTTSFKRLTDARKWVQDTESAIREGRHFKSAASKKHTVAEMITRYCTEHLPNPKSNKSKGYNLKEQKERSAKLAWWSSKIGYLALADVTHQKINGHLIAMEQSAATCDKYLKNLQHVFTIAIEHWEWLQDNPAKKVPSPELSNDRVRYLSDDERGRLLIECKASKNKHLYLCVVLAISSGMRLSELMELRWPDVNVKDGFLLLHKTKNGERRRVPLAGIGLELLREHAKVRQFGTDLLFPSDIIKTQPVLVRKAFINALRRAGITDFRWHDLRHTTASELIMNGASLAEVAEILGHKSLAMTKRYAHLSDSHVSNVVARMNEKVFGGAS
jgi:integrase